MRFLYFLFPVLFFSACGGRNLDNGAARRLILSLPQEALEKEDVEVVSVSQTSGSEAVVETRLKTAFHIERVHGRWEVKEVRLGHGQWEKISNLEQTLEMVRKEETNRMLDLISDAIRAYAQANGSLPQFKNYTALSDILSPKFMTPLIRLDAWRRPFEAERMDKSIVIRSCGSDGEPGTVDDIRKSVE